MAQSKQWRDWNTKGTMSVKAAAEEAVLSINNTSSLRNAGCANEIASIRLPGSDSSLIVYGISDGSVLTTVSEHSIGDRIGDGEWE